MKLAATIVLLALAGCAGGGHPNDTSEDTLKAVAIEWRPSEWQYRYWSYIALGHSHAEAAELAGRGMEQQETFREEFELLTPRQKQASREDAEAKFKLWQRWYWSRFEADTTGGHDGAATRAGAMLRFSGESSRRRFEALTPEQVSASRHKFLSARAEEARTEREAERKLAEWEQKYRGYIDAGWRHQDAADAANTATGNNLRADYEHKRGLIEHQVKQKDWKRWYDIFIRDGYRPEEATYKADQIVR